MPDVPNHILDTPVTSLGTNAVQKITLTGLSDGTYGLVFDGLETVSTLVAATTAAEVQTALENIANISPGDVAVSGSAGGPFTITFGGKYAGQVVPQITAVATKGTPVNATVTAGGPNPLAVQRGTGLADATELVSPLEGTSPAEQRAANPGDYGD